MNANEMMLEIAAGLRDVIQDTPEEYLKENPEDAYIDLASRFIFRLLDGNLSVVSTAQITADRMRSDRGAAAQRIFDILTRWLSEDSERSLIANVGATNRFAITMKDDHGIHAYFQGVSLQDACAQAAQTIVLDEKEAAQ